MQELKKEGGAVAYRTRCWLDDQSLAAGGSAIGSTTEQMAKLPASIAGEIAGRVLVVDDDRINRLILSDVLKNDGHDVIEAEDGDAALRIVHEAPPDTICLDVMMPSMDGFTVCRALKLDPKTAHIPVLLITALSERADRIAGIEAGANDFLSKPVDMIELALRVRNAVYHKRIHDRLQQSFHRLRELEELRDNLTHMVIHDLRNIAGGILVGLDLLREMGAATLNEPGKECLDRSYSNTEKLVEMANTLLDVSKLEAHEMPLNLMICGLVSTTRKAAELLGGSAAGNRVLFEVPDGDVTLSCDPDLIQRVVSNLVSNALKFSPDGEPVRVRIEETRSEVTLSVLDRGRGIPPKYHDRIFQKFGQVERSDQDRKRSTGLGLTFCKLAIEAHNGRIGVDSDVGKGSKFWFSLPRNLEAAALEN